MKKHCTTCTCKQRERCIAIVPASDYRKRGRCLKAAAQGYKWCTTHGKMGVMAPLPKSFI